VLQSDINKVKPETYRLQPVFAVVAARYDTIAVVLVGDKIRGSWQRVSTIIETAMVVGSNGPVKSHKPPAATITADSAATADLFALSGVAASCYSTPISFSCLLRCWRICSTLAAHM
jgi:hypothetical protein